MAIYVDQNVYLHASHTALSLVVVVVVVVVAVVAVVVVVVVILPKVQVAGNS